MGNFCCKVLPVPLKLVSYYAANLNFGALFNINVKSAKPNAFLLAFINFGRYLVPTGQTPLCFHNTSILVHPRKGLHKPPSNKLVEVLGTAPRSVKTITQLQRLQNYLSIELTFCQVYSIIFYMPKMRKFKFDDGKEVKEVEALSFKKAVKSFQGSSKAKMVTIEWTTKKGIEFVKQQILPLGRAKKLGR